MRARLDFRSNLLVQNVVYRNEALLVAFSNHTNQSLFKIYVTNVTADEFGFPAAGATVGEEESSCAEGQLIGEARVMSVLSALVGFWHLVTGFRNRHLVRRVSGLLGEPYSHRQATYDLPRLKRKGLIVKIPRSQRYQLTLLGRRVAVLFTKTYGRVLAPGLVALDRNPARRTGKT